METRHRFTAADGLALVGGGALLASAFMYWVSRGPGSGLRGHRLVDAVVALGRHVPAMSAGRLTIVWYLVPALGAASWIAVGLRGARSLAARIVAGGALVMSALSWLAFRHLVGTARLGWGPKAALFGAIVLCVAAFVPIPVRRPRSGPAYSAGGGG